MRGYCVCWARVVCMGYCIRGLCRKKNFRCCASTCWLSFVYLSHWRIKVLGVKMDVAWGVDNVLDCGDTLGEEGLWCDICSIF